VTFPYNVYLAAVVGSFLTAAVALPLWVRWCLRIGLVDDPGHRKIHDQPVPLAGGLAVMTGLALPTLIAALVIWGKHSGAAPPLPDAASVDSPSGLDLGAWFLLNYGLNKRIVQLAGILLGGLGMLLLGVWDDKTELRPAAKFAGQALIAAFVAACGVRITLFLPNPLLHYVVTILWILTVINAFNFMDNMNGLCAGLGAIGAWFFASLAAANGQYLVALLAFGTFGALLGFLPYNFPQARAFLGDAGSHLVGYLLAILAILPHFHTPENPRPLAVLIPLLVLAVPLFDLAWVVLLRWRNGRPFYIGDTNHLSHRLVRLGLTRTRAVIVIWIIAATLGALSYLP